jgi:hypothetical protein
MFLQFHADPTELVKMAAVWADEFKLHMATESFGPPFQARSVSSEDVDIWLPQSPIVNRISLIPQPPKTDVSSPDEFFGTNTFHFLIKVGMMTSDGLRESSLQAMTDSGKKIGRTVIRRLRKDLNRGAEIVNPLDGATRPDDKHLYTDGAAVLAGQGIPMLAIGGWAEFRFTEHPERPRA